MDKGTALELSECVMCIDDYSKDPHYEWARRWLLKHVAATTHALNQFRQELHSNGLVIWSYIPSTHLHEAYEALEMYLNVRPPYKSHMPFDVRIYERKKMDTQHTCRAIPNQRNKQSEARAMNFETVTRREKRSNIEQGSMLLNYTKWLVDDLVMMVMMTGRTPTSVWSTKHIQINW